MPARRALSDRPHVPVSGVRSSGEVAPDTGRMRWVLDRLGRADLDAMLKDNWEPAYEDLTVPFAASSRITARPRIVGQGTSNCRHSARESHSETVTPASRLGRNRKVS
jgi:hypothetical protein